MPQKSTGGHPLPPPIGDIPAEAGTYFEDRTPIRNAFKYLEMAETEVNELTAYGHSIGDLTCNGQLSRPFLDAYVSSKLEYCSPSSSTSEYDANSECFPVQGSKFTSWWPYKAAYCISRGLKPIVVKNGKVEKFEGRCEMTEDGKKLQEEMKRVNENFMGTYFAPSSSDVKCKSVIDHTVLIVPRQDQWNPFHASEDFVTTFLAMLIAGTASPELMDIPLQLVFNDRYELEQNHFSEMWDRIGTWTPRRLSLDPFKEGTCLTNAIHSIGAGASLFSATGVGRDYNCISTIAWAASHYYRSLFGLHPSTTTSSKPASPINILFLSRQLMDAKSKASGQQNSWRESRRIENEDDLLSRLTRGLKELCPEGGDKLCEYEDVDKYPYLWTSTSSPGKRKVRFQSIDPISHTLPSQINLVGHSTIIISTHGGQLGLEFFMAPGSQSTVVELQSGGARVNRHFHNMAMEMGRRWVGVDVGRTVDVEKVWGVVEGVVKDSL